MNEMKLHNLFAVYPMERRVRFMKRMIMAGTLLVLALVATQVSAAINWRANPEFSYRVNPNGGVFSNQSYLNIDEDVDVKSSATGNSVTDKAVGSLYEFPLNNPNGTIHLYGEAGKGPDVSNGVSVQGAAEVRLRNFVQGADIAQRVTLWMARKFTVDQTDTYSLGASLLGSIDFSAFDSGALYHASYQLVEARVTLDGFTDTYPTQHVFSLDSPIDFGGTNQSDDMEVELSAETEEGIDILYTLKVSLIFSTDIQNAFFEQIMGPLNGTFEVGTESAPLTLSASLSLSAAQYTLTVNTVGEGTVTLDPAGGVYDENTTVGLTAAAAAGWVFDGWTGDVSNPDAAVTTVTMSADKTVTATFVLAGIPPVGDAGDDETVAENSQVTLDGSDSQDPDGSITAYQWEQIGDGPQVALSDPTVAQPVFTAPNVGDAGVVLAFQLTVSDNQGLTDTDSCEVTVTGQNDPPTANAGADQTVDEGALVTLNGANSTDPDYGDVISFQWEQIDMAEGPAVTLSGADTAQPTFTAADVGVSGVSLSFLVTVTDAGNLQHTDTCIVNVTWVNQPPVADAGLPQTVGEATVVTLDGTNCSDPDAGDSITYLWEQIDTVGGVVVTLSGPDTAQPSFMAPDVDANGLSLTFRVTVTDSGALEATDTCIVNVVEPGGNQPPEANAGDDQSVEEGMTVFLDAVNSTDADPGDGIASYEWSVTSGSVVLSDPNVAQPFFVTGPVDITGAVLILQVTVTDAGGLQDTDSVSIAVADNGITGFPPNVLSCPCSSGHPFGFTCDGASHLIGLDLTIDPDTLPADGRPENMIFGLIDVGMKIDVPGGTGILTIYLPNPVDGNYQWFKHSPTLGWIVFDRDVVSGGGGDGAEFNAARDQITIYITDNGPYDDDPTPGVIRDPSGVGTAAAGADSTGGEDGGGGGCFISTASGGSSPVHVQGASDGNRAFGWIIVSMLTGVVVDFCGRWRRR
jgi:uncharacterized repeat protein (TIGR02543 family)